MTALPLAGARRIVDRLMCRMLGHRFPTISRGELTCGRCPRRWTSRSV